jgi:hypothetical protein
MAVSKIIRAVEGSNGLLIYQACMAFPDLPARVGHVVGSNRFGFFQAT